MHDAWDLNDKLFFEGQQPSFLQVILMRSNSAPIYLIDRQNRWRRRQNNEKKESAPLHSGADSLSLLARVYI